MYYLLTPVSTPPKKEGWYPFTNAAMNIYTKNRWISDHWKILTPTQFTHYLAPVEEPGGMRWVKASERVPTHGMRLYLKGGFSDTTGIYVLGLDCFYGHDQEDYIDKKEVQWLDESQPAPLCVTVEQLRAMWEAAKICERVASLTLTFDGYLKQHFGI